MITLRDGNGNSIQSELTTQEAQDILRRIDGCEFLKSMAYCRKPTERQLYFIHKLAYENKNK